MADSAKTSDPQPRTTGAVRLKLGVMGNAGLNVQAEHLEQARQLGEAIAEAGCIVITDACPGLPLAAARGAKSRGGMVVGISPALSLDVPAETIRRERGWNARVPRDGEEVALQ